MDNKLTKIESERYSRHILLEEIGQAGQEKLKAARVLVIGAGGLGCPALQYLAAAGIGTIGIVDADRVELSNLQRQILFGTADIGKLKAIVAAERLRTINEEIKIQEFPVRLSSLNAREIISNFDIVLDGSDNFSTRYLVNDACVVLKKPLISASILKFTGQLSVFNASKVDGTTGPSLRCLFPEPPSPDSAPTCGEVGVLGVVPGVMGTLQTNECIKLILGLGQSLIGKLLILDLKTLAIQTLNFSANLELISKTQVLAEEDYSKLGTICAAPSIEEVDPQTLKDFLEKHNAILLDVRSKEEHIDENLGGDCLPVEDILQIQKQLEHDKFVVLYCKSGVRSRVAGHRLLELGYKNVFSLRGGITAYRAQL